MARLGDLVVNIGANTQDLNKKLGKVRRDMRSMTSNFTAVGQSMTRSITMPLSLVGGASLKLAVDFESAMAKVKAVSGATAGDFKRLEQSAKDLGASTVFTAREVAALQLEYSRLGFSAGEILEVQEATLNLAQATGSDLAQAAEVAGATLRAFGIDASETGKVTDIMAASFSASALDINTFQDSMKYVAPIAKAAGVSVEETSAMLAVLANSGIKGSQAGTALRRILQEMQGTTGTLTDRFAELSAKGIGLEGAMDEVGRRAATSLLVLTEGAGQVDELTGAFENSAGAAKDMADVMNDTAKGQLKAMTSALEGAGIALGEALMPHLKKAAEFVRDLATRFRDLDVDTQSAIVNIGLVAAAMGPLLIMIPKIIAGISGITNVFKIMTGAMLANPFAAAAIAATALAGVFITLTDTTSQAKEKTDEFIGTLNELDETQKRVEINKRIELLKTEKVQLEIAARAQEAAAGVGALGDKFDKQIASGSMMRYTEQARNLAEEIKLLQDELTALNEAQTLVGESAENTATKTKQAADATMQYMTAMTSLGPTLIAVEEQNKDLQISYTELAETIEVRTNQLTMAFERLGNQIGDAFARAIVDGDNFGDAMKELFKDIIRALISNAIANAIANASSATNPANQASAGLTIPAFIAAAVGAVQSAFSGMPALAQGGLAYGPTTALVGDNKNASIDPEVIAPLSKLRDYMGGEGTQVYGRISGDDIVISNERAMRDRNRFG